MRAPGAPTLARACMSRMTSSWTRPSSPAPVDRMPVAIRVATLMGARHACWAAVPVHTSCLTPEAKQIAACIARLWTEGIAPTNTRMPYGSTALQARTARVCASGASSATWPPSASGCARRLMTARRTRSCPRASSRQPPGAPGRAVSAAPAISSNSPAHACMSSRGVAEPPQGAPARAGTRLNRCCCS